ncbi:hypothetical protein [Deinococcus cellulosilyticus]|uniref:Uncharacterized protein n=1 Tax=Deinococcus cellulosilyticus (strain DSM 18568 / NBRC 106333 / KACC 11606 / 5516J-15) TaxID=1223518 RepID=A0A511MZB2_DEIC1|nr:hypothetical protein [Deinococcus cellulosilyticus]GEM45933.1 hypothetical protein DC3_15680 [Deinococcus cellulosilyticus NBRC 106333 = KACC 11606]
MTVIPPPEELAYLIRCPREWNEFYLEMERDNRLPELMEQLQRLPVTSVRDARIGRILFRLNQKTEAKALVYQHRTCFLCQAWYFAMLVNTAEEDTLRKVADLPLSRPLGAELINLEAEYRLHLSVAIAAQTLRRFSYAEQVFNKAMMIAEVLGDQNGRNIVLYEKAWLSMYDNQLEVALERFLAVLKVAPPGSTMYDFSGGYAAILSWLLQQTPQELPERFAETLGAYRGEAVPVSSPLVETLGQLRKLTREFHLKLPLFYVQENQHQRSRRVQNILSMTQKGGFAMSGFLQSCARALALSMEHRTEALELLEEGFKGFVTNVSLMSMTYWATYIQIHANLPHAKKDREVKAALRTLVFQFSSMPDGQKQWLIAWMKDFTPVTLYILGTYLEPLKEQCAEFVLVDEKGARYQGKRLKRYPVMFMNHHVIGLLAGEHIPIDQRVQAYRHHHVLADHGAEVVIYQPIIDLLQKPIH